MIEVRALVPIGPPALPPLSLSIAGGEVVALTAPSGAGKTTYARSIAGLHPVKNGEVRLDGAALGPIRAGRPHPVQYLFQDAASAFNPLWTVGRILQETGATTDDCRIAGVDPQWMMWRAPVLSGGQAQRVALARALTTHPRLLICDEITAALDPVTQAQLWRSLLVIAKERKMALLVITHDAALRDRIADRSIRL